MGKKKLPGFLVVGAAKSGTTSLYHYLKQHPEVSLNEGQKESWFFTNLIHDGILNGPGDVDMSLLPKTLEEYSKLFENAEHDIIGEVSPDYLFYHHMTIPKIREMLGDVKIIIILRNPVERAFSSYMHLVRDGRETLEFKEGLEAEEQRIRDKYWFIWYYKSAGLYYQQVNDYINNFKDVKVCLYDDLNADAPYLMRQIYAFLGANAEFKPNTTRKHNPSGEPRSKLLNRYLKRPNRLKDSVKPVLKTLHLYPVVQSFMNNIKGIHDKSLKAVCMNEIIRSELIEYYKTDIMNLEAVIDRDLSHWLK